MVGSAAGGVGLVEWLIGLAWHDWHPQVPPNTHAVMESRARGWRSRTPLARAMPPPVPVGAAAPGPCTCRLVATPLSLDRATVHMVALCATQTQTHTLVGFDRLVRALVPAPGRSGFSACMPVPEQRSLIET